VALNRLPQGEADGLLRPLPAGWRRITPNLREALLKLQLNDAALSFEPETSAALGFGFRVRAFSACCTWIVIQERLEREVQSVAHRHIALGRLSSP